MHIAILTWGISTEREVALRSGVNMKDWIEIAEHTCESFDLPLELDNFLLKYKTYDFVIPVFHGMYGEDGQITAFLDTLGCRVAYSPFMVHGLCMDKNSTNLLATQFGVKIPESYFLKKWEPLPEKSWEFPLIVKPNRGWSSIATSKVKTLHELLEACETITDDDILIQKCIEGREFTVWVYCDTSGHHSLPIMEVITRDGVLFDYHEKYETDGYNEIFPELEEYLQKSLETQSEYIAKILGCTGVVRIDWRYDGEDIYFLEVNTIPGFTAGSFVPKMWKKAGKTEKEFVKMLFS